VESAPSTTVSIEPTRGTEGRNPAPWPLSLQATVVMLIMAVSLVAGSWLTSRTLRASRIQAALSLRTQAVLSTAPEALLSLEACIAGQRGYLLTGQPRFFQSYRDSRESLLGALKRLRELTASSPKQQRELAQLQPLIDGKLGELAAALALHQRQQPAAAVQLVQENSSQSVMEQIHTRFRTLEESERRTLRAQELATSRWFDLAGIAGTLSVLTFAALAALFVSMARRDFAAREQLSRAAGTLAEELQQTLDTAEVGLTRCSRDFRYRSANAAYGRLVRRPLSQIIGHSIPEVIGAESFATKRPYMERVLRGERVEYESDLILDGGEVRRFHFIYTPWRDAGMEVIGWVSSVSDITETKRASDTIAQQNALLKAVSDHTREAIYVKDRNTRLLFANPPALQMLQSADGVGRTNDQNLHESDHSTAITASDLRVIQSGQAETIEETLSGETGPRYVLSMKAPWRDDSGEIHGIVGISHDITARRQSDALLIGQKHILELIAMTTPLQQILDSILIFLESQEQGMWCGLLLTDDGLHFRPGSAPNLPPRYRDALYEAIKHHPLRAPYFGICAEAAATNTSLAIANVSCDSQYSAAWRQIMQESGLHAVRSTPVRRLDGRVIGCLACYFGERRDPLPANPHLIEVGTHLLSIALEREATLRAAQERAEQLEHADRQKNEFLAMLAHELRNPLAPIRNASDWLAKLAAQDPRLHLISPMLQRQTSMLVRIVDDLLDVSRITQGRVSLQRRPLPLRDVVLQAVETVDSLMNDKNHRLAMRVHADVWVVGDNARLVQSVVNLLSNAAKYSDPGAQIHVDVLAEAEEAVIRVADTGCGIGPELLPHVFELFVQSERTLDRAQGGLGIGLSLAKKLVDLHGGRITAYSEGLGSGATFEIRLPRMPPGEAAPGEAAPAESEAPMNQSFRVLIVDDNVDAADSVGLLLAHQGYRVDVAYCSEDALALAAAKNPDVMLLDIGLPRMNGYEVAARMRENPALNSTRLIAMTGYGRDEDRRKVQEVGFDAHLIKPVDFDELQKVIAQVSS